MRVLQLANRFRKRSEAMLLKYIRQEEKVKNFAHGHSASRLSWVAFIPMIMMMISSSSSSVFSSCICGVHHFG